MLIVNACSVTSNTDSDFNPCQPLNLANSPPFLKILPRCPSCEGPVTTSLRMPKHRADILTADFL